MEWLYLQPTAVTLLFTSSSSSSSVLHLCISVFNSSSSSFCAWSPFDASSSPSLPAPCPLLHQHLWHSFVTFAILRLIFLLPPSSLLFYYFFSCCFIYPSAIFFCFDQSASQPVAVGQMFILARIDEVVSTSCLCFFSAALLPSPYSGFKCNKRQATIKLDRRATVDFNNNPLNVVLLTFLQLPRLNPGRPRSRFYCLKRAWTWFLYRGNEVFVLLWAQFESSIRNDL